MPVPKPCLTCGVPTTSGSRCPRHTYRNGSTRAWRTMREVVLKRDGYRCPCGAPAIEVDHIVPKVDGGADVLSNLRALCSECHTTRHRPPAG